MKYESTMKIIVRNACTKPITFIYIYIYTVYIYIYIYMCLCVYIIKATVVVAKPNVCGGG